MSENCENCYNVEDPISNKSWNQLSLFEKKCVFKLPEGNRFHWFEPISFLKWFKRSSIHPLTLKPFNLEQNKAIQQNIHQLCEEYILKLHELQNQVKTHTFSYTEDNIKLKLDNEVWIPFFSLLAETFHSIFLTMWFLSFRMECYSIKSMKSKLFLPLQEYNQYSESSYTYLVSMEAGILKCLQKDNLQTLDSYHAWINEKKKEWKPLQLSFLKRFCFQ